MAGLAQLAERTRFRCSTTWRYLEPVAGPAGGHGTPDLVHGDESRHAADRGSRPAMSERLPLSASVMVMAQQAAASTAAGLGCGTLHPARERRSAPVHHHPGHHFAPLIHTSAPRTPPRSSLPRVCPIPLVLCVMVTRVLCVVARSHSESASGVPCSASALLLARCDQ